MTEPTYEPLHQVEEPSSGGLAGAFGPEAIAAILSIVVVVALLASRLAFSGLGGPGSAPTPSAATTDGPTRTAPAVDRGAIASLLTVDQHLLDAAAVLKLELDSPPVDAAAVKSTLANMNQQALFGVAAAQRLGNTAAGVPVATQLLDVYTRLAQIVDSTSGVLLSSQLTWQKAARDAVATVGLLPALDTQLGLLLADAASPSPSVGPSEPVPSASVAPTASLPPATATAPPPTAPPSTLPSAPPSVPPATPSPSPSPGPNALVNPGFEQGVGLPWQLWLDGNAMATLNADNQQHNSGTMSARIDITVPTLSRNWISLQQAGLEITSGATYHVSIAAKSAAPRQIRVRIIGPTGQTLGNGTSPLSIGPAWSVQGFDVSSIVPSTNASIAIDVGGSGETVWLDDVSVSRIPPGAP